MMNTSKTFTCNGMIRVCGIIDTCDNKTAGNIIKELSKLPDDTIVYGYSDYDDEGCESTYISYNYDRDATEEEIKIRRERTEEADRNRKELNYKKYLKLK